MDIPNDLEVQLLKALCAKYPDLISHIPFLKVNKREISQNGMVVHFEYISDSDLQILNDLNVLFSNEDRLQLPNLKNGLGFVIDVSNGKIEYLEFMTYNEKWNGKIHEYQIVPRES